MKTALKLGDHVEVLEREVNIPELKAGDYSSLAEFMRVSVQAIRTLYTAPNNVSDTLKFEVKDHENTMLFDTSTDYVDCTICRKPFKGFVSDFRYNMIVVSDRNLNEIVYEDDSHLKRLDGMHLGLYRGKRTATINRSKTGRSSIREFSLPFNARIKNIIIGSLPDIDTLKHAGKSINVAVLDPLTAKPEMMDINMSSISVVNKHGQRASLVSVLNGVNTELFEFCKYNDRKDFDRTKTYFIIPKCQVKVNKYSYDLDYFEAQTEFTDNDVRLSRYLIDKIIS